MYLEVKNHPLISVDVLKRGQGPPVVEIGEIT